MHQTCGLKIVKQSGQLGKLHRLPDRKAGENHDEPDQNDADVEQLLDGIVAGEIVVLQTQSQRVLDGSDQLAPGNGKELRPEAASDEPIAEVSQSVEAQNPHAEKMPLQG